MEFVRRFNIREGLVSLWSMHTTCALFINEFQTALLPTSSASSSRWSPATPSGMHNIPSTPTAIG